MVIMESCPCTYLLSLFNLVALHEVSSFLFRKICYPRTLNLDQRLIGEYYCSMRFEVSVPYRNKRSFFVNVQVRYFMSLDHSRDLSVCKIT